jgi:Delta14-sterol reductase (lamin-B receptor)
MDKKRVGRPRAVREVSPPPASRTRSKSPARIEVRKGRKPKKTDSEEISSSSQSSTPVKNKSKKEKIVLDDSSANEEVADINTRNTRLSTLRKRLTPVSYKNTPTPSDDIKRSISRNTSSLTKEDSDEEEEDEILPKKRVVTENLGIFTRPYTNAILLIQFVSIPILLSLILNGKWTLSSIIGELKNPATYCSVQALSFILAIHCGICLISLLPIGRIVTLPDSEYQLKFNGILSAIVIVGFLLILEVRNLDALTAIYNNIDRLLVLSTIKGLYVALESFLIAKYRPSSEENKYGKSGKLIVDYVAGRELNPKLLGKFDIKQINYNESIIYLLLINITLLFKNITLPEIETAHEASPINELIKHTYNNFVYVVKNSEYNATAFVVSGLLILYALDILIYEHHLATSFQINSEGCGAEILLRFATFPFLISFLPRFLLAKNVVINNYILALVSIIFVMGLIVKRSSNCLKYEYRMHPANDKFKGKKIKLLFHSGTLVSFFCCFYFVDLATLPTFQNRRLIISKLWSRVRQPNLLGEIVIHLALLIVLAFKFDCASFFGIFFIVKYLVYRSIGINRKNAIKYESSWQRYTSAVKYNLLPRVY